MDVTHEDAADLDHVELDVSDAHDAVRGRHLTDVITHRRVIAETAGVALRQGDHRGAGVDHEGDAAAIDDTVDREMPARVALDHHAARPAGLRGPRGRP